MKSRQASWYMTMVSSFSLVAIVVACTLVGCSSKEPDGPAAQEPDPSEVADAYAEKLSLLVTSGERIITHEEAGRVIRAVRRDLAAGLQEPVAQLVLHRTNWSKQLWYLEAEAAFADSWRCRSVPLTIGASANTVAALAIAAREGLSRRARVAAATALISEQPDLSKEVLLREYADLTIDPSAVYTAYRRPFAIPLGAAEPLRELGIRVPDEMTTVLDVRKMYRVIVQDRPSRIKDDDLIRAGNLYNRRLRSMVQKQQLEKLSACYEKRFEQFRSCIDYVQRHPRSETEEKTSLRIFEDGPEDLPWESRGQ